MMGKDFLNGKVEPFILSEIKGDYSLQTLDARQLLTHNRLDLAFKLAFLDLINKNEKLAKNIYREDIRSQTLGKFQEFGNHEKNSFDAYCETFKSIYEDVRLNGFNGDKSIIPLCKEGTILNGAHRVASAIRSNSKVTCVQTDQASLICDYKYFYDRNIGSELIETAVQVFIKYADNVYLAFLWPSVDSEKINVEDFFNKIIYKKTLDLTSQGAFNLLIELYKDMDWIGNSSNDFYGARRKLLECFPSATGRVHIVAFQANNLEEVRNIKQCIRAKFNIGYSSIHITDNKSEAFRVGALVFNTNGIHFLNYAKPYKYTELHVLLDKATVELGNEFVSEDFLIDGSSVLNLYGIRKNADIDYIALDDGVPITSFVVEPHDSELKYHLVDKTDLIYNADYFFIYKGFKFVSFAQLFSMKQRRNNQKDRIDIKRMRIFLERKSMLSRFILLGQSFSYQKIKLKRSFIDICLSVLKKLGLHAPLKKIYWSLRNR